MPKYLIKQIVEAIQWTEGPCPKCGGGADEDGICYRCDMWLGAYLVQWPDWRGDKHPPEIWPKRKFEDLFDQLKKDADTDYCSWCNGTGLNGGRDALE